MKNIERKFSIGDYVKISKTPKEYRGPNLAGIYVTTLEILEDYESDGRGIVIYYESSIGFNDGELDENGRYLKEYIVDYRYKLYVKGRGFICWFYQGNNELTLIEKHRTDLIEKWEGELNEQL